MKQSEIEKKILEFWRKDDTFKKSVERKAPKGDYVFYDGPPFATGTPHYGHIVASLIKDMVPRYWTMRGFRVERRWGWDCHGLPIENIVEKEHGFKHKKDILAYGVDKFNEDARSKVLAYVKEWREVIGRLGRWVDFSAKGGPADEAGTRDYSKGAYMTMDLEFMESVWWVFKELYDKGLLYEAYRSMHICPRCETTLAQSEVAQGYQEVTDLSVVAKFKIKGGLDALSLRGESRTRRTTRQSYQRTEARLSTNVPQRDVRIATIGSTLPRNDSEVYLLAWTTTPWTLPGNMALAVGEDITYVKVKQVRHPERSVLAESKDLVDGEIYVLAKDRLAEVLKETAYEIIDELKGKDLVGLEYKPLFPYYSFSPQRKASSLKPSPLPSPSKGEGTKWENAFKVYAGDFVNTEEGTGIVHIAPAFGADDYELSKKENIPFVQHVGMDGTFKDEVTDFAGVFVKHQDKPHTSDHPESPEAESTDVRIVKYLAKHNLLFSKQKYKHTYPHCWRCDSPLLNYATSSWFVAVEKIKKDVLKNAEKIEWMPEHIKEGRFGQWLAGSRDWSISRQRFWGSVLPVWKCTVSLRGATRTRGATRQSPTAIASGQAYQRTEARLRNNVPQRDVKIAAVVSTLPRNDSGGCGHMTVIGSIAELEKLSGQKITDLHKHFIDPITFPCQKCEGEMRRIPDVLDCWFEAGSMPYGQLHYPFENEKKFKSAFPAEFIAEGVDQTRAWFYYLHVLATALKKKPAFKQVIVNGIVLAEDGKKMSKRLKNYPDPAEMFEKYGADAVRYYLATSPVLSAEDFCFSEKGVDEVVKKVLLVLYNVLSFYKLYEPSVSLRGASRTRQATRQSYQHTEARLRSNVPQRDVRPAPSEAWGIAAVASTLPRNDSSHVLDRWIIAKTNQLIDEVTAAYDTYDLNKATRPIAEFVNELSTWYLRRSRDRIKEGDTDALATLKWVLEHLSLVMAPVMPFTAEQVWMEMQNNQTPNINNQENTKNQTSKNYESVHLQEWPKAGKVDTEAINKMEIARKVVELGLAERAQQGIKIRQPLAGVTFTSIQLSNEYTELIKEELNVRNVMYKEGDDSTVTFDTNITPELAIEGNLRELVRTINAMRKKAGLTPGDVITLTYHTESEELKKVFEQCGDELKKAVIAGEVAEKEGGEEVEVNGEKIKLSLRGVSCTQRATRQFPTAIASGQA